MKYAALFGIVSVVALANYYIMEKLFPLVNSLIPALGKSLYIVLCSTVVVLAVMGVSKGLIPLPDFVKRVWITASGRWMGLFIYLLLLFVISDLVLLAGKVLKVVPNEIPDKVRATVGAAVLLCSLIILVYGEIHANNIRLKTYDVSIGDGLKEEMTIAMISDIHLGAVNSEKRLPEIVSTINAQNPDVVCLAGDIFDNDFYAIGDVKNVRELLKSIKSEYGVYACLGNHDAGDSFNEMLSFLDECGITLLNDETQVVGGAINLIGRVDPTPIGGTETIERISYDSILENTDDKLPVVVMEHNPANTGEYGAETALVLSGHTHMGQLFPGDIIVKAMYGDKAYGQSELPGGTKLVVSSGAGTWGMPVRVGTDCEVVMINLMP